LPFGIKAPAAPPLPSPTDDGSNLWELLYESLGYHVEDDVDGHLQLFCEGFMAPKQDAYDLARERDDQPAPFAVLFDPDQCPARFLPYSVQYVGIEITPEMSEEQIREEFREPTGWTRGREPAIRLAGARTLEPVAGEPLVIIIRPETPEVGHHYIRTLATQTPDPARTEAAFRAAVPAWEELDYAAFDGPTYSDSLANYPTYADRLAALPLYADVPESTLP
jgi:hypothetical protein